MIQLIFLIILVVLLAAFGYWMVKEGEEVKKQYGQGKHFVKDKEIRYWKKPTL